MLLKNSLCGLLLLVLSAASIAADKPNILLILTDDLGHRDLSCYGSDLYRTPHLDRLAEQGTRFTHAYTAAPVCSPTRASIMTGKFPARVRLTDWLTGHVKPHAKLRIPDWTTRLPEAEITIAEVLKPQGYATAWFGKWHLGEGAQAHGFDAGKEDWEQNRKKDQQDPKGVFTLNREAIAFLDENKERPFFLTVSHYSPHGPVRFEDSLKDEYQATVDRRSPRQSNAGYAAMIEALDTSIGQLLAALEERGLAGNTLVLFSSDNGGELNFTNNAPLRDGKGTLYEGGVRVPLIARWPGHVPAGKISDQVVCSIDFLPTFAALAGAQVPDDVDGLDISDVLTGKSTPPRDTLCWHYPHYHRSTPCGAILKGDWKLIEWYEDGSTALFKLDEDPYEQRDLSATQPEKKAELLAELDRWRKSIGAQMPTPNPDFNAATAEFTEQQLKKQRGK
ncbi:Choline-sulfatase [Caulifigura coniformis]|uniref:Choline-sulfatase n=1 Tax=Caulifigura coniformis TaxID=2527983 RepID=A0A517S8I8_9PLAN|nr:sulfatase [Caulifigura coniformis]QDT52432.1 Choline-sulfatase [Caulifigura coniformis]